MSQGNIVIMMIMMVMVMLFPLSFLNYGRGVKVMDAYLGGANVQEQCAVPGSGRPGRRMSDAQLLPARFLQRSLAEPLGRGRLLGAAAVLMLPRASGQLSSPARCHPRCPSAIRPE